VQLRVQTVDEKFKPGDALKEALMKLSEDCVKLHQNFNREWELRKLVHPTGTDSEDEEGE
jgi:DNA-directed RNA polymerase subunit L